MPNPYDADTFFDLGDDDIVADLESKSADEIEALMIDLQNHVDELRRKRGIVADIYASKRQAEAMARELAEMSDEHLAAELARRQANAQTIIVDPVTPDRPVGDQ